MTNDRMAQTYLEIAKEIFREVESALDREVWSLAVRRSQEVVELSLKAALRAAGIEVPKVHDVGIFLKDYQTKYPESFRREIDRLASISRRLRREREISFYGDEETGSSPQRLYTEADGRMAREDAKFVLDTCESLMDQLRHAF